MAVLILSTRLCGQVEIVDQYYREFLFSMTYQTVSELMPSDTGRHQLTIFSEAQL